MNAAQQNIIDNFNGNKKALELFNKYNEIIGCDVSQLVKRAENKVITTQNNYGNYLPLLIELKKSIEISLAALLLIYHGANKLGVQSCIKILNK